SGSNAPSPMTLSRWDTQSALYAFGTKGLADKAFFHPGIGMWQFDSAGFWNLTAATAISSWTSAAQAATVIAQRYCASTQTDPVKRRQYAWAPWYYCQTTLTCENLYQALLVNGQTLNVARLATVSREGGMLYRTCRVPGIGDVQCGYVDPSKAQGYTAFALPNFGPSPISAPFYVFEANGREYRYWLKDDTGYAQSIRADKPVTANARTSLVWSYDDSLCDLTAMRGACAGSNWTGWSGMGGTTFSRPAVIRNKDGRLEVFVVGGDGQMWRNAQVIPNGYWSGFIPMGGRFPLDSIPSAALSPDGRIELFAVGVDRSLYHAVQLTPGGNWSQWVSHGGIITSRYVALGTNADGRLEAFARGLDGALHRIYQLYPNGFWSGWNFMGSLIMDGNELTVERNADGRLQVFMVGWEGYVWTVAQISPGSTVWGPWTSLGGPWPTKSLVAGRNADGRLQLFMIGIFGIVATTAQTAPNGAFAPWSAVTVPYKTTPRVIRDNTGKLSIITVSGPSSAPTVFRQLSPGGAFGVGVSLGGASNEPVELGINSDGRLEAFMVGTDYRVYHAWNLRPPS
ncbi:MAG: hypothetical protein N2037_10410, partial [Acidimicrobiales bacterium]|nr:hypothetical protein [Acidimicrobiales bacterium]